MSIYDKYWKRKARVISFPVLCFKNSEATYVSQKAHCLGPLNAIFVNISSIIYH